MDVARSAPCGYPPGTPQGYDRSVVVSASSPGPGLLPLGSLPLPPQHAVQLLQTPPRATLPGSAMAASVQKPQHLWRDEIHNQDRPFVPKLRSKPNALTPFELRLEHAPPTDEASSYHDASHRVAASWYANPYAAELADFAPSEAQLLPGADRPPRPLHSTACMWVGTEAALQQVVQKLSGLDEFAVDVEQHSYRSYRGFIALVQISTRDEDFLIDAIALHRSMGDALNEVFTNPRITKVMHGADAALQWLQRDLGIYVVGLFDTGQAARVLEP